MTVKSMRPNGLPLLGSNQDSPDPESDAAHAVAGTNAGKSVETAQIRAGSPTIPPTVSHPLRKVRKRVRFCWVCTARYRGAPQSKRCPACRTKPGREKAITVRRWPASFRCRQASA
jgi:hypothetical protein